MSTRPTPFGLVFTPEIASRFESIANGFAPDYADTMDRDAFLMNREAASIIHELVPQGGMGEAVAHLAALVHHAYLFWLGGCWTFALDRAALDRLTRSPVEQPATGSLPDAYYLQIPRQVVWGRLGTGEPFQPLDGCFVQPRRDGTLRVLGVFGLHPDRMGFAVVEAEGTGQWPGTDGTGTAPFAPNMEGGPKAGLHSVSHPAELLLLAGQATRLVALTYPEVMTGNNREIRLT